jgi:hypothetical protein
MQLTRNKRDRQDWFADKYIGDGLMTKLVTRRGAIIGGLGALASARMAAAQDKIVLKMGTLGSIEYSPISSSVTSAT